jgi:glycosyltransferase involved in cell wall biosynthesis
MSIPRLSVIIPVRDSPDDLRVCLERLQASSYKDYEVIVVDDASTDGTPDVAAERGAQVVRLERQSGPAAARNRGAEVAQGDYLFFLDADVGVHPDTLSQMVATFEQNPDVDAVFGSYDTQPQAANFISQYKNLFHHFVHQQGREEASTFWSGCGAIKRSVFGEMGGFDASYGRPCIEDIELGMRLRRAGRTIRLNKRIQVTHLKRWTLWNLLKSDLCDRGIPWTELILRERSLPSDLNLKPSQRLCAVFAGGLVGMLGISSLLATRHSPLVTFKTGLLTALALLLGIVCLNTRFYAFFVRQRGLIFAVRVVPLHLLYYVYSIAAFAIGVGRYVWRRNTR